MPDRSSIGRVSKLGLGITLGTMIAAGAVPVAAAAPRRDKGTARPNSADGRLASELVQMEKASWVAWQAMDAAFWDKFLSDDHVELSGYVGVVGKAQVIAGIAGKQCKVASYKLDDFIFRRLDSDTVVLVYRAEQDTTCGKVRVPSPVWATSVFERRGGRWQNVLYEHTPVIGLPKQVDK